MNSGEKDDQRFQHLYHTCNNKKSKPCTLPEIIVRRKPISQGPVNNDGPSRRNKWLPNRQQPSSMTTASSISILKSKLPSRRRPDQSITLLIQLNSFYLVDKAGNSTLNTAGRHHCPLQIKFETLSLTVQETAEGTPNWSTIALPNHWSCQKSILQPLPTHHWTWSAIRTRAAINPDF